MAFVVSVPPEIAIVHEPRRLGVLGKTVVAIMVVATAALAVGTAYALRMKWINDEKRERATNLLVHYASEEGQGDDVVFGEDVPDGIAAIESYAAFLRAARAR